MVFARFILALSASVLVLTSRPARADILDDPHLSTLPRTAEDLALIAGATAITTDFTMAEPFEAQPGGAATVPARPGDDAFSKASANMGFDRQPMFAEGRRHFNRLWVAAPADTKGSDGFGPLSNARSCAACHIRDGRGHPPEPGDDSATSMILRLSVPAGSATAPDPVYGGQLQDVAAAGHRPEFRLSITYDSIDVALAGGEAAQLRRPAYATDDLGYGPLAAGAMLSPRTAQQMIGLGLLEAVPAADILAWADPDDSDSNGISGRANIVWSVEFGMPMLGRFGHKAAEPTLRAQAAAALSADMGLSSPLHPAVWGDCTVAQTRCRTAPDGATDGFELSAQMLDLITFYSRNLAVPARRQPEDPGVLRGKQMFHQSGCPSCHRPKLVTHRLPDQPEQSFQLIWPHTDLLLHDMGGGLADNRPEAGATGQEWRTAPLWGIGLTETVSGKIRLLHDGRARTLLEAILWHGGEAAAARAAVVALPKPDRAALIRYLQSL